MTNQFPLFEARSDRLISVTPEVTADLHSGAAVGIGVSGGKDSCALAFALADYLDSIGHRGPRVLIHSDLGRIEWKDSLPTCQRLADRLGLELIVVRRAAGDMIDRWETRWRNNVERYRTLECVKLILPWSTASMRFCTSELKTAIICRELVRRFPGRPILSAVGIRRQESHGRRNKPVASKQPLLINPTHGTTGLNWNAIIEWSTDEVYEYLAERGFPLHEAYTTYGSSRVSCSFCILGSQPDILASTHCADNHDNYRALVDLEIRSTFSFQSDTWLADAAPHLLSLDTCNRVTHAKKRAFAREQAEAVIPIHLLYEKGWPTCVPTPREAALLCDVRRSVADAVGLPDPMYSTPAALIRRYQLLMAEKRLRDNI